jgi:quinolinate synthase
MAVSGAAVGDSVALALPAAPAAGIVFQGFVSAAETVALLTVTTLAPASRIACSSGAPWSMRCPVWIATWQGQGQCSCQRRKP